MTKPLTTIDLKARILSECKYCKDKIEVYENRLEELKKELLRL